MTVDFRGKKLGTIFRALGLLSEEQELAAVSYAKALGCPIGQACVRLGFLEEEDLLKALAAQAGVQMTSISDLGISPLVLGLVPSRVAERLRVIPLELVKTPRSGRSTLVVATAKPRDLPAFDELEFLTGHRISPVATTDEEIDAALLKCYGVKLDASDLVSFDDDAEPTMSKDIRTPSPTPRPTR